MPDEEPQIDGMTDKGEKSQISGAIAFEGVYFKYPQRPKIPILRELNVSVHTGIGGIMSMSKIQRDFVIGRTPRFTGRSCGPFVKIVLLITGVRTLDVMLQNID
ncbi:hypothetical protein Q1695_007199 [Nippostrongylus brasiliensis]|nr:hypothetical protein Q1695_007199 [Nippostrongylus brasiliensis]